MASQLNIKFWNKAYLLEFKMNGVLTDAFTFSVPPQSEEFSFPQRTNKTQTFGGAVIADYGNDMVDINLSGSTINQEVKLIYKSSLGVALMTGEQEIFYLRDLLKKYGERDNLQKKEVYLYSLNGGLKQFTNNPKWWRIYVGKLDITRNSSKPFCYNYRFTALGSPEVNQKKKILNTSFFDSLSTKVASITASMTEVADLIEEYGGGLISELSGYIGTLRTSIETFNIAVGRYSAVLSGVIDSVGDVAVDAVMLGDKVLSTALRYYPTITADVWNACKNVRDAGVKIYNYCANLDEEYFSESAMQNVRELFNGDVSDTEIADTYSTLANQELSYANELTTFVSKNFNTVGFAIVPGGTGEDDSVVLTYGYKVVALTDSETSWDQLAQDYYGDASLSTLLATYNNLPTDQPLTAGQSILIPNLNMADSKSSENEVYNSPDVKDNYGKDLLIEDMDFAVYNGDLAVVGGVKNLEQALLNRYSTLVGARIRQEVYGIRASIGDALNASSALIQASVHQTTVEDPRVDSVEDITFDGEGDKLTVAVIYIDKNGAKRNFGGTI